jgi:hypothetical protein
VASRRWKWEVVQWVHVWYSEWCHDVDGATLDGAHMSNTGRSWHLPPPTASGRRLLHARFSLVCAYLTTDPQPSTDEKLCDSDDRRCAQWQWQCSSTVTCPLDKRLPTRVSPMMDFRQPKCGPSVPHWSRSLDVRNLEHCGSRSGGRSGGTGAVESGG